MKKLNKFFQSAAVLALVFCMVLTLLPTALAAADMPQETIDEELEEQENYGRRAKKRSEEFFWQQPQLNSAAEGTPSAERQSFGWQNTGWQNTGWQGTEWQNTGWQNTEWQNTGWQNTGWRDVEEAETVEDDFELPADVAAEDTFVPGFAEAGFNETGLDAVDFIKEESFVDGSGFGEDDYPADGSGFGEDDYPADGSEFGEDDYLTDGSEFGENDYSADSSGFGENDYPADGSGFGENDYPADGSGFGEDDYLTPGSEFGEDDYLTPGSEFGEDDYPADGSEFGEDDYPADGNELGEDEPVEEEVLVKALKKVTFLNVTDEDETTAEGELDEVKAVVDGEADANETIEETIPVNALKKTVSFEVPVEENIEDKPAASKDLSKVSGTEDDGAPDREIADRERTESMRFADAAGEVRKPEFFEFSPDKTHGEKSYGEKPYGEKPYDEKPYGEKPHRFFHGLETAAKNIWQTAAGAFETLQDAVDSVFNKDPDATEATVRLRRDAVVKEGEELKVEEGKSVIIDLCKKTLNVISGFAAKITGKGSVTLENGTVVSASVTDPVVQTSVDELTIRDVTLKGSERSFAPVLDINGGNVRIDGNTSVDAGYNRKTAIDIDDSIKDANVLVNTLGVILGKVAARDVDPTHRKDTDVLLHNGFFSGEVISDPKADVKVDGGNYLTDVYRYVGRNTDYAEIVNPYGRIFSAGKNIPWSARFSSMRAPTLVNVLKSDGSIRLPANAAVKNSVRGRHFIFVNGKPLIKGGISPLPCYRRFCCNPCKVAVSDCNTVMISSFVVDGANSIWYKGCKDGLTCELTADVSYVTVDGTKVNAIIDGVFAELEAETLEALEAGNHTVKFVLKNGSTAVTNLKVVPDDNVIWSKGSKNGLRFEMTGKIAKVLIDHVKADAEIDGKDASVSASVLQDLKTGNHTVEFVLESGSHVVTSITVK